MVAQAPAKESQTKPAFPLDKVREILRRELEEAEEESATLHEGWEPVLDSLRMVTVVTALDDLFDFPLPPEKVVKKGGYTSVDEGVDDMTDNLRRLWENTTTNRGASHGHEPG